MKPPILLASGSPRRIFLLREAGYNVVDIIRSDAEEILPESHEVEEIVVTNAGIKARDVLAAIDREERRFDPDVVLLAADTLVVLGNRVYPKPKDWAEAEQFMHELGGRRHRVLTGVFLHHFGSGRSHGFCEATHVTLQKLTRDEMYKVWETVNPLDKAGAYAYQGEPNIVASLDGSETNVIGLPMERLARELTGLLDSSSG